MQYTFASHSLLGTNQIYSKPKEMNFSLNISPLKFAYELIGYYE